MRSRVLAGVLSACIATPGLCLAQSTMGLKPVALPSAAPDEASAQRASSFKAPRSDSFWAPFREVPGDFSRFFSGTTLKIVAVAGAGAMLANRADDNVIEEAMEHLHPVLSAFTPGNVGGGFIAQTAGAFGTYAVGRIVKSDRVSGLGGDLLRAQILSQGIVQSVKFSTRRQRPDGDDRLSFPSGHTASAFATAGVLKDHFGWKAGVPAYAFGSYVALSRISANKHHLSDVLMGAAVGIAAAHSVTVGSGRHQFSVGVSPTLGGAAVTFQKK